jgi:hypothetical protein
VWLKIQPEGPDLLTFTWGNTRGPHPCVYQVGRQSILQVAADIRAILEKLAKWWQLKDPQQCSTLLRALANEGERLRFVIFDCPSHPEDVDALRDWIFEQFSMGDTELAITADSNLYVPWGFVFDGDTAAVGNSNDPATYDFWSLKFKLSMVFSASGRPAKSARPRASYKLLSIINSEVLAGIQQAARDELLNLLKVPVGIAYNLEYCEKLVAEAAKSDTLLHFFGHCKDGKLDLGEEKIDSTRFKMMIAKLSQRSDDRPCPYSLIFLNACETLTGELDASFRSAAARPGLCGIIATEASVPRAFAANFGLRLLKSMVVDGKSIGDTMETLRRDPDLWPLNLLYSCYAPPDYRIVP